MGSNPFKVIPLLGDSSPCPGNIISGTGSVREDGCDASKPGGPLTTRQPAEYKWMSGYPTPLQKIGQSLLCTGSSTQMKHLHILSQTVQYMQYISNTATWAHKQYSIYIAIMSPTIYPIVITEVINSPLYNTY